jgi:hypothetical protein
MSDPVIITIIVAVLIFSALFLFRDALRDRLKSGGSLDAKAKFPGIEGHLSLGPTQTPPQLDDKEKAELENKAQQWKKLRVGHIYWFSSDLSLAIPVAESFPPDAVKHYIRQAYWHANRLELGIPIEERFARLCDRTHSFTVTDWNTVEKRQEIAKELASLRDATAFVIVGEDKEFQPNPP